MRLVRVVSNNSSRALITLFVVELGDQPSAPGPIKAQNVRWHPTTKREGAHVS